jgi:large subunit ribosomal protein L24e
MPACIFCKKHFKEPRGLTIFSFDGRAINYCSSKCRRNMENLKRDYKKVNWVRKSQDFKNIGKEVNGNKAKEKAE